MNLHRHVNPITWGGWLYNLTEALINIISNRGLGAGGFVGGFFGGLLGSLLATPGDNWTWAYAGACAAFGGFIDGALDKTESHRSNDDVFRAFTCALCASIAAGILAEPARKFARNVDFSYFVVALFAGLAGALGGGVGVTTGISSVPTIRWNFDGVGHVYRWIVR